MDRLIKGAIHIHSLYSSDGKESVKSIRDLFLPDGVNFLILTEHEDKLTELLYERFVQECKSLSTEDLIIIPGLEFKCDKIEILALNIEHMFTYSGLHDLLEKIRKNNGIAILAHPHKYKFNIEPYIKNDRINGVEIWNYRYDGKWMPRISSIKLMKSLKGKSIYAYAGWDFHERGRNFRLYHYLSVDELQIKKIIFKLKNGDYYIGNGKIILNSRAEASSSIYYESMIYNIGFDLINSIIYIGSNLFRRLNVRPPKVVYELLGYIK